MNYTGQFKNINNTLYQIDVDINNGIIGSTEIVLAGEPFKVDYNAGETIYEPLKLSNATCSILSSSYLFDIYSSTAQGTKLTLKNIDSNSVEWVGYITPNIYTQAFEQPIEQIDLEAIDGLSTLENYTYNSIDFYGKNIKSFQDILIQCIKQCNCYNHIYINQNNSLTSSIDKTKIIDKLFIAEQNFFNNDSTPATDTTPAIAATSMNYKDVLTEITKYLGYTIVAFGDSVYFLDYDYISKSNSNYSTYSTVNNWLTYSTGTTNLIDVHSITAESFKANGGTMELATTYNQISIKTSLFKDDSLIPDFFDVNSLTNITTNAHNWNDALYLVSNGYKIATKFFKSNNYDYIWYDNDVNWNQINLSDPITTNNLLNNIGAIVNMQANYKISDGEQTALTYNNFIQLVRHINENPAPSQNKAMPVLRSTVGSIPANSYLNDDYYINIGGSGLWTTDDNQLQYFIDPSTAGKYDTDFDEINLFITAKLQIGNKYWNGTSWTITDSTFKILFSKGTETHLFNKWFSIKNTPTRAQQLNVSGQLIPILKSAQLIGNVELTLYTPLHIPTKLASGIRIDNVFIKDLSFKLVKENLSKNDATDTEYLNVINTNFVNKFSDLSFKVCSQTNKGMNYSSVIELSDTGTYKYNSGIFNKSLNKSQLQEYNIIEKYVDQYSTPKKILNLTLSNNYYPYTLFNCSLFPADKYIINKMSIDYYNSNNLVTIVEKI